MVLRHVGALRRARSRTWLAGVLVAVLTVVGCGSSDEGDRDPAAAPASSDPGPIHVHGLGVNPADGALFIATHTGLFRLAGGKARRVAGRWQDTMGFTVLGPDRFLASGHPDGRERLPPFLGLIRSTNAGRTWSPVSLMGEQDFHVLEARRQTVYGYGTNWESRRAALLVSEDGGRSWTDRRGVPAMHDLAIHPGDSQRALAATGEALVATDDAGRSWRRHGPRTGLIEWPAPTSLYVIDGSGRVFAGRGPAGDLRARGEIGGEPHAFLATGETMYAALEGGTIKRSDDGGQTWQVAFAP